MKDNSFFKDLRRAFVATVPVLAGYSVLGMAFGILLFAKGYGPLWSLFIALTVFAGSMQYVMVDLLATGAGLWAAAITTFMVNARHLFYGVSLIEKYKGAGPGKAYLIHGLTDETYSIICSDSYAETTPTPRRYYYMVTLLNHFYWTAGCYIGGLIGSVLPFNTEGIDFALTALFITIMVEQWLESDDHRPAVIGLLSAVVSLIIFGTGSFLIPAMVLIAVSLSALRIFERRRQHAR